MFVSVCRTWAAINLSKCLEHLPGWYTDRLLCLSSRSVFYLRPPLDLLRFFARCNWSTGSLYLVLRLSVPGIPG